MLIALHSFTPVFHGVARPWHAAFSTIATRALRMLLAICCAREGDLVVGDNEPYAVSDATDYTIPVHGERRGLPHVELEIRQDLIATADVQEAWAELLALLLPEAWRRLAP